MFLTAFVFIAPKRIYREIRLRKHNKALDKNKQSKTKLHLEFDEDKTTFFKA